MNLDTILTFLVAWLAAEVVAEGRRAFAVMIREACMAFGRLLKTAARPAVLAKRPVLH